MIMMMMMTMAKKIKKKKPLENDEIDLKLSDLKKSDVMRFALVAVGKNIKTVAVPDKYLNKSFPVF